MKRAALPLYAILLHVATVNAADHLWAYPSTMNPSTGNGRCTIQFNKQSMIKALLDSGVDQSLLRRDGIPSLDWNTAVVALAHMPSGLLGMPNNRFLELRGNDVIMSFNRSDDVVSAVVVVTIAGSSVRAGSSSCSVRTVSGSSGPLLSYIGQSGGGKADGDQRFVQAQKETYPAGVVVGPPPAVAGAVVRPPSTSRRCESYASMASQAYSANVSKGCRFEASNANRWNNDYQFHYDWCMRLDPNSAEAQQETQARTWMLQHQCPK
jgi:hypothetical protein